MSDLLFLSEVDVIDEKLWRSTMFTYWRINRVRRNLRCGLTKLTETEWNGGYQGLGVGWGE